MNAADIIFWIAVVLVGVGMAGLVAAECLQPGKAKNIVFYIGSAGLVASCALFVVYEIMKSAGAGAIQ